MQLVFLYGPPAVGKYTIGVELAALTGFRLFHNHLTVNLVSAVFGRDSDVWLRMLRSVRRDVLTEAARHGVSQLTCARDELFRRITSDSRRALDKLIDPGRWTDLLDRFDMVSPAPFGQHLRLDVTYVAPSESATKIIQHYGIDMR